MQTSKITLDDIVFLADFERSTQPWGPTLDRVRATGVPMNDGDDPPKDDPPKDDPPKDDPPKDDGDDEVKLSKKDHDNLQRQAREAREEADRLKRAADEADRKKKEDEGQFKDLAETEKKRADDLEARLARVETNARVEKVAARLKFRDPDDVVGKLSDDDLKDDSTIEKALKALAKSKPYLVDGGTEDRQRKIDGEGDGSGKGGEDGVAGPSRMARAYAQSGNGG